MSKRASSPSDEPWRPRARGSRPLWLTCRDARPNCVLTWPKHSAQPSACRPPRAAQPHARRGRGAPCGCQGRAAGRQSHRREQSARECPIGDVWARLPSLSEVPAEYEVAIEVALGGHLQDVVVDSWVDARDCYCLSARRQEGAGPRSCQWIRCGLFRAWTCRRTRRWLAWRRSGEAEERLSPVVEMLLGRTIIARDLKAARRTFDRLRVGSRL